MGETDELKISIDYDECIGDGLCVEEAAETFELDDEEKAIVKEGSTDSRDKIIEAAKACPLDIITVEDKKTGEKIYPED